MSATPAIIVNTGVFFLYWKSSNKEAKKRKINNKVNAGCKKTISSSYLNNIQIYNFFNR